MKTILSLSRLFNHLFEGNKSDEMGKPQFLFLLLNRVIKKIQKEKAPQVLRIVPNEKADWSDSEDLTDSDEDEGSEEEESGIQVLPNTTENTQQPEAGAQVKPPARPTTDSGEKNIW